MPAALGARSHNHWATREVSGVRVSFYFCLFVFYQVRYALKNPQDLGVAQLVVGKVKDAESGTLPEMLNVLHSL